MKKGVIVSFLVLLLMAPVYGAGKYTVSLTANFLSPADGDYKDVYGSGVFFPELKLGYKISGNFSLWGGLGLLSAEGSTPVLDEDSKSNQNFISFGAGYNKNLKEKLDFKFELGLAYVNYREEALGEKISDSAFGFKLDAGLLYTISNSFFAVVELSYLCARDTLTFEGEEVKIKLGGLKGGIGVGVRF